MKKFYLFPVLLAVLLIFGIECLAQVFSYQDSWGKQGVTLEEETTSKVVINYSISNFSIDDIDIDGNQMKTITLPEVFLPNDEGAPNLPGTSQYIAISQYSNAKVKIIASRIETISNVEIAPAPRIPFEGEDGPLQYKKDAKYYSKDEFYPVEPVKLSENSSIRGLDVVMLGITPFQYNPVTKELIVYRDLNIEVTFTGGNGHFGDDRLRSRWWDPIIANSVLNHESLPIIDFDLPKKNNSKSPDYEYVIITLDDPDFLAWADSIKLFRTLQGIYTGVVTTTEIGGNTVSAIEAYVDDAYNNWDVPPSAVLLLGDYGTGTSGIISQFYTHPAGYPDFVSDNRFADVTGNELPDIAFARITANNAAQLEVMITKFLDYERNPPSDFNFYDHPITALGWQTERWFQLCSEVVGGYFKNVLGKNPVRINAIYSGTPGTVWSTATNTSTVVNYFGPSGLGYIPATPAELGGWSGGTASDVVNAINSGSFMLQHRDHGYYEGWGEPAFSSTNINSLTNINNKLPYIFSINCQTGAFHRSSETFAEKFHRHTYSGQNSGALGVMAATEVSYSFVNDTYLWGVMDNMFPDFMPAESTTFPVNYVMPAFGNAAGKHFLYASSWPYNTGDKLITYRLFHHHGGAFLTLYTEVPQYLTVSHAPNLIAGATSFNVTANAGSLICLTVNGTILGTATGTGSPVAITIPAQSPGNTMVVTVTKQNYYRYSANVPVIATGLYAEFTADNTTPCTGSSVNFTDLSAGGPTSWNWTFEGGTPGTFSGQNPPPITYNSSGSFDITLYISDGGDNDTEIKYDYIVVSDVVADFSGTPTTVVVGNTVTFTDNSSCNPTSWTWLFSGGTPSSASGPGPHTITYNTIGTYDVTLSVSNAYGADGEAKTNYIDVIDCNYCATSYSNTSDDYISNVTFNTINNNSGSTSYSDFTSINTNVTTGNTYPVSVNVTVNGSWVQHCWVWIDWNRDCDFDDTGEGFDLGQTPGTSGTHTLSANITIPAGASLGSTRMRVSELWNTDPAPCTSSTYGEAEDYTVIIQSSASPPVADFVADDTTPTVGQTVNFTDLSNNSPTSWSWSFSPSSITYTGGTNSSSQNPQVQFNTSGYYTVTLVATNAQGSDPETKTNYILVGTTGTWSGATSTDWNNASNWETLIVPTATDDVTIPPIVPNWPILNGDLTLGTDCNNITMEGTSELTVTGDLTIPTGYVFNSGGCAGIIYVGGDWNNFGTFNPGLSTVVFDGTSGSVIDAASSTSGSLQTTFAGGNGSNGNMFDIVALNNVTITSFDANLDGGDNIVHIYYKTGTYVGSETNASAWTLIGTTTVTSGGNGSGTPVPIAVNISIPSGQTFAFYVHSELGNAYTNGSSAGSIYVQDANIQILEGCGKGAPLFTGGTYTPRVFNGIVHYSYGSGSGSVTYNNLVIDKNNAEVSNTVDIDININGDFTINPGAWYTNPSGKNINIAGNITLVGNNTGNSSYLDQGVTSVSGTTLVQSYYSDGRWHFLSSPLTGAESGIFMDIYLKTWHEDTYSWEYITATDHPLTPGIGFEIWSTLGDPTVSYTGGGLNTGNISPAITATDVNGGGIGEDEGWNFIGNPYPSAIDLGAPGNVLPGYTWTNLDYTVYLWNGAQYATYNPNSGYSVNSATRYIPSMQAFFVKANDFNPAVTIPNSARVHSTQSNYKLSDDIQSIRLMVNGSGYSDETLILTHDDATTAFDSDFDAYKLMGLESAPQLYTLSNDLILSINVVDKILDEDVFDIGFKAGVSGVYSISATEIENFGNYEVVLLEDKLTNTWSDLNQNPVYQFSSEVDDDPDRFRLHFMNSLGVESNLDQQLNIYSYEDNIYIHSPASINSGIVIYDMMGQSIMELESLNQGNNLIKIANGTGYYLVKVLWDNQLITKKVLIK